jgi:hypothetical protein
MGKGKKEDKEQGRVVTCSVQIESDLMKQFFIISITILF